MKYDEYFHVLDDLLEYIFTTPSNKLPDKLQRAKQVLEHKDVALLIFKACHMSIMDLEKEPVSGTMAEGFFFITSGRPKTKRKPKEDIDAANVEHLLVHGMSSGELSLLSSVAAASDSSHYKMLLGNESNHYAENNTFVMHDKPLLKRGRKATKTDTKKSKASKLGVVFGPENAPPGGEGGGHHTLVADVSTSPPGISIDMSEVVSTKEI